MSEKKLRVLGYLGENKACDYLTQNGYKVLNKNYYSCYGEIDIICIKNSTLIFVEVKLRKAGFDTAFKSVSASKQKKIVKTAQIFLSKNPNYDDFFTRFDVIAITGNNKIKHLKDAFRC